MSDRTMSPDWIRSWLKREQALTNSAVAMWRELDGKNLSPEADRLQTTLWTHLWGPVETAPAPMDDLGEHWERRARIDREWREALRTARPVMRAWTMLLRRFPLRQRRVILRRIYYDFTLPLHTVFRAMAAISDLLMMALLDFFERLATALECIEIAHPALEREVEDRGPPGLLVTSEELTRRGPPSAYVSISHPRPGLFLAQGLEMIMT